MKDHLTRHIVGCHAMFHQLLYIHISQHLIVADVAFLIVKMETLGIELLDDFIFGVSSL